MEKKIVNFDELKFEHVLMKNGELREFEERYEFCLIKEYEEKYTDFTLDSIQVGDIFVQILQYKNSSLIVSYEFLKNQYDLHGIVNWLDQYKVGYLPKSEKSTSYIQGAESILEAIKFRGNILVLYKKGTNRLAIHTDLLPEITEYYAQGLKKIDTSKSKSITNLDSNLKVILNGQELDYVPRIDVNLSHDLIISNGHIMVAKYIDDYEGCVGFYADDSTLPIAWLHDKNTTVYIDIYEYENGKQVVVDCKYLINLDEL